MIDSASLPGRSLWLKVADLLPHPKEYRHIAYTQAPTKPNRYACYAGNKTEYCGGNDLNNIAWFLANSINVGWYVLNSTVTPQPVGKKRANGFGLYDMTGNVWQFMQNKFDKIHDWRAMRGGSWSGDPSEQDNLRAACRFSSGPALRFNNVGFRLSRTLP